MKLIELKEIITSEQVQVYLTDNPLEVPMEFDWLRKGEYSVRLGNQDYLYKQYGNYEVIEIKAAHRKAVALYLVP